MNHRQRVLKQASRRLLISDSLRRGAWCAAGAGAGVLGLVVAERVFGASVPWPVVAWAVPAGAVAVAAGWTWVGRRSPRSIALALDEAAELREALSTAQVLETQSDPWSKAVIEASEERARAVDVRRALPIETPRAWPVAAGAALAAAIAFLAVPDLDLFGKAAARQGRAREETELRLVRETLKPEQEKLDELLKQAGIAPGAANALESPEVAAAKSPEDARRAIVKELSSIARQAQEKGAGDQAQRQEALADAMRELRSPGEGELGETARKLARGDFRAAHKALQEIQEKLRSGELGEADRAKLEEQAANLARQLDALAQEHKPTGAQAAQALQQGGMSAEQAQKLAQQMLSNPAAAQEMMRQAMQQMQNLSPEQRRQLQQMAARMQASEQMRDLARQMQKMAEGMKNNDPSSADGAGDALGELAAQQSQGEASQESMDAAMAQLEKMMAQCSGGLQGASGMSQPGSAGEWAAGDDQGSGRGSGAPGSGTGASIGDTPAPTRTKREIAKSQDTGKGPVIASEVMEGESDVGESHAEFVEAVEAAEAAASEALDTQLVPRNRQDLVKRYFSTMKRRATPRDE